MKIGIICGFPSLRAALAAWLTQAGGFTVSADIASVDDFRRSIKACPDVWLIHIVHAQELSVGIHRLHDLCAEVPILALLNECQLEVEAIKAGARGLVSWDSPPEPFFKALQAVGHGEFWLSDRAAREYVARSLNREKSDQRSSPGLSKREAEVLAAAGSGRRSAEIANALHLSISTVNSHLRSVYKKLGVDNRVSAALAYLESLHRTEGQTSGRLERVSESPGTGASEPAQTKAVRRNKQTKQAINGC